MFVSGPGIATARALLEATNDSFGLNVASRKEVKVYYKVGQNVTYATLPMLLLCMHPSITRAYSICMLQKQSPSPLCLLLNCTFNCTPMHAHAHTNTYTYNHNNGYNGG